MQTRRLFAQIWRINAIIILLVGLIAGAVLSAAGYALFKDVTRTRHVNNVGSAALGDVRESTAELGSFEAIRGSSVVRAALVVRQTYVLGSGSKEAGSTRNYLYFDPSTRSAHWLRPAMNGLILSSDALPDNEYGEPVANTVVHVNLTVEKDTDGDDRLSESDAQQIAISSPDGRAYRVLVAQADRLNEATLLSPTRLLILYSLGTRLAAVEVNPTDFASPVANYDVPVPLK